MADLNNENQNGVFGEFAFNGNNNETENTSFFGEIQQNNNPENINKGFNVENAGVEFKPIDKQRAVTKQGLWTKIRSFLFQEIDLTAPIKIELTPYQQKVENEINEFLHQEVSFKGIAKLFGRK
ncbi:MAG: hypothetical protein J5507_01995 [Clostridia bacterium]|nr:hypothetical protein [Clostridia bacterium]